MMNKFSRYLDYPKIKETFVMHHVAGFGDQGGEPIKEHEIVSTSNNLDELIQKGEAMYPQHPSGWTYNRYSITVNTKTEDGKRLYQQFVDECNELQKYVDSHPDRFETVKVGEYTFTIEKIDAFNPKLFK